MSFGLLIKHEGARINILFMDIQPRTALIHNLHGSSSLRRRETYVCRLSFTCSPSIWRRQFVVPLWFPDQTQLRARWHHSLNDLVTGVQPHYRRRPPFSLFVVTGTVMRDSIPNSRPE